MTDQQPHTPTTEHVREIYSQDAISAAHREAYEAEFNRWLAAHEDYVIRKWTAENDVVPHKRYTQDISAAEQRGAIKALRDAADIKLGNGYYEMLVEDELNTRADQLEGDDE